MIKKIIHWWQSLQFYVIADPDDNSVTLSRRLFQHLKNNAGKDDEPKVFVFRIKDNDSFGFMLNPEIEQPTQLCDIQYNDKYHCVGFETLCPSVGRIFYEYGLPNHKVKISVSIRTTANGKVYYQLEKPHGKYIRKYEKS
nr:MAG TPA: hypothetical protein [Caudoviricetes sp.]